MVVVGCTIINFYIRFYIVNEGETFRFNEIRLQIESTNVIIASE